MEKAYKTLDLRIEEECPRCQGYGNYRLDPREPCLIVNCSICGGKGKVDWA